MTKKGNIYGKKKTIGGLHNCLRERKICVGVCEVHVVSRGRHEPGKPPGASERISTRATPNRWGEIHPLVSYLPEP